MTLKYKRMTIRGWATVTPERPALKARLTLTDRYREDREFTPEVTIYLTPYQIGQLRRQLDQAAKELVDHMQKVIGPTL